MMACTTRGPACRSGPPQGAGGGGRRTRCGRMLMGRTADRPQWTVQRGAGHVCQLRAELDRLRRRHVSYAVPDTGKLMTKATPAAVRNELNPLQVFASAAAAVTAAVLGSRLGVAGTIAGAALGSAVTAAATTLYLHSMERARAVTTRAAVAARSTVAGRTTVAARTTVATGADARAATGPDVGDATGAATGPDVGDATGAATGPAAGADADDAEPPTRHRLGWGLAATGAVIAFALALTVITGLESARGRPLSGSDGGTTLGHVLRGPAAPATQPSTTPTPTPTPTATGTGITTPTPSSAASGTATPTSAASPSSTVTPTATPPSPVTTSGPPTTTPPADPTSTP